MKEKKNIEIFDLPIDLFQNGYLSNGQFYSHIISNSFDKKWTYCTPKSIYVYHDPITDIEIIVKYDINQVEFEKDTNGFIKRNKYGDKIIHSKLRIKQDLYSFLISKEQFIPMLNKQLRKDKINKLIR